MIDTLEAQREKAAALSISDVLRENLLLEDALIPEVEEENYAVMTLHRPSNVDARETLEPLCNSLKRIAQKIPKSGFPNSGTVKPLIEW